MELKDFIAESLRQIVDGVEGSQGHARGKNAQINPGTVTYRTEEGTQIWDQKTGRIPQVIEFDVAVTVTEGQQSKGGVGVFVGAWGVGAQGQSEAGKSSVSRIKFSIPVFLPFCGRATPFGE